MTAAVTAVADERRRPTAVHDLARNVHAELFKLRATPGVWLLAALAPTAALAGLVLSFLLQPTRTAEDVRSLLSFSGTGGLLVIMLGLVVTAGEHRHGTIVPTALVDPRRTRSFWGQTVALGLLGLVIGIVASALTTTITVVGVSLARDPAPLSAADVVAAGAGATVYTMVAAVVGGGIGTLARNQVAAAIAVLIYLSTVDPLLSMALPSFGQFGPTALGIAISGASPDPGGGPGAELLAPVVAGAVWSAYAAALQVAAFLSARRRELP